MYPPSSPPDPFCPPFSPSPPSHITFSLVPFPYPSSLLRPPLSLSISTISLSFFSSMSPYHSSLLRPPSPTFPHHFPSPPSPPISNLPLSLFPSPPSPITLPLHPPAHSSLLQSPPYHSPLSHPHRIQTRSQRRRKLLQWHQPLKKRNLKEKSR